jgi:hypothetical protein
MKLQNIHLVTVAINEPFLTTQKLLHNTITNNTKYNVIHHKYTLEDISKRIWFKFLEEISNIYIEMVEGKDIIVHTKYL